MSFEARGKTQPMIHYVGFYLCFFFPAWCLLIIEELNVQCCCRVKHGSTQVRKYNATVDVFFKVSVCPTACLSSCLSVIFLFTPQLFEKLLKIIFLNQNLNTFVVRRTVNQVCKHLY